MTQVSVRSLSLPHSLPPRVQVGSVCGGRREEEEVCCVCVWLRRGICQEANAAAVYLIRGDQITKVVIFGVMLLHMTMQHPGPDSKIAGATRSHWRWKPQATTSDAAVF